MTTEINQCKFCNKTFKKLSTLSVHQCEQKRRMQQKNEVGVQLGFQSYLKFFEMTQGSASKKTYDKDFVESPYYSSFVRYGQYLVQIRAINIPLFTTWLLKNNKKLDHWTKDAFYDEFLFDYLRKEHPNDALERSLTEIQRWADEDGVQFNTIFKSNATNKICNMIINGRISPWVIYNCDSGIEFLEGLNDEQIAMVIKFIDPTFWTRKFKDYVADSEFIKEILQGANI